MKDHEALDYDLWQLQLHLLSFIKFNISWKNIKSHASTQQRKSQGEIPSRLNEQVDNWAGQAQSLIYSPSAQAIPQIQATPFINSVCIHGPIRPHFKFHATCKALQEYLCHQNNWSTQVFHTIAWRSTRHALKKFPREKRVNVIKYLHKWQRTGRQIKLFSVSAAPGEAPEDPDKDSTCPACGRAEDHLHFFSCNSPLYTPSHIEFLHHLKTTAQIYRTSIHVWRLISLIIHSIWYQNLLPNNIPNIHRIPLFLQSPLRQA